MTEATTVRIRSLVPTLAPAERRVALRVCDDPGAVAASTISDLATACETSVTTVTRFSRAVGFTGYQALRLALATELGREDGRNGRDGRIVGSDIGPGDDLEQVVEKVAFADARAVEETAEQLDVDELRRVVEVIAAAQRVDIYGVGASAFVALDLQQKLHRIGRVAFAWADPHVAMTSAALLGPGDVAIGLSHSGVTRDTVDALELARGNGVTTIAITNFPRSSIAAVADHVLTTAARETTFRSGATASRLAQLTVVDCVFVGVAQQTFESSQQALQATHDAVESWRRGRRSPRSTS
ncbi:MurR/RpiR family transcriptional regulator [Nocardioides sp.]|uniref:MurR/RpiR family transcriptional regulator n=1 Tax=Nocardioides sp. TaxID=35761 RepID=UPI002ED26C7C